MELLFAIAPHAAATLGLVVLSALFSGTEVAIFALRRIDREQMTRSGRDVDSLVLQLLERPRRLVTTFLIGKEVVNALVAVVILDAFVRVGGLPPWPSAGLALAVALPLVLLIGEVLPKTLALKGPIPWARAAIRPLYAFWLVIMPVRLIIQGASELLLRPLGDAARARPPKDISEEEFRKLVDAGSAQGQVDARERRLIHRVFEFADKNVGQIMTPRDKMFALSFDVPTARLVKEVAARGFSRVPIYQRSLDNVRGVLNAKDLVSIVAGQQPGRLLSEILHEPLFVPRTTPVKRLFRTFKQKKVHMALVVNEYGKVLGIVTMDDVLAQLFGKLRDEREGIQSRRGRASGSGRTPAPGVPVVPEAVPDPALTDGEAVSRGEDVAPIERDEDDVTPPAIDLPLDHSVAPSHVPPGLGEPDPDPAAPIPVTDAATGPSGPIDTRKATASQGERS